MNNIGYDWRPADKRKPKAFEVLKFKRIETNDDKEFYALWNGDDYYIFDLQSGHWKVLEEETASYIYAYIPKESTRYLPYYAIAYSRRQELLP